MKPDFSWLGKTGLPNLAFQLFIILTKHGLQCVKRKPAEPLVTCLRFKGDAGVRFTVVFGFSSHSTHPVGSAGEYIYSIYFWSGNSFFSY